jgi:hypothetical protein
MGPKSPSACPTKTDARIDFRIGRKKGTIAALRSDAQGREHRAGGAGKCRIERDEAESLGMVPGDDRRFTGAYTKAKGTSC